jgi:hypothetical protein
MTPRFNVRGSRPVPSSSVLRLAYVAPGTRIPTSLPNLPSAIRMRAIDVGASSFDRLLAMPPPSFDSIRPCAPGEPTLETTALLVLEARGLVGVKYEASSKSYASVAPNAPVPCLGVRNPRTGEYGGALPEGVSA